MKTLFFITVMCLSTTVSAGCWLNGKEYPPGSIVKGYICTSNGTWQKR